MIKQYLSRLLMIGLLATGVVANSAVAETVDLSPYDTYEEATIYLSWYDEEYAKGSLLVLPCEGCSSVRLTVRGSTDLYQNSQRINFTRLTINKAYMAELTVHRASQSLINIYLVGEE